MEDTGKRRSLRTWGCLGCAGVVGVFVALLAVLGALGWVFDRAPVELTRKATQHEPPPAVAAGGDAGGGAEPGRIVLDLAGATLDVVPGPAGEPIRMEADYDVRRFDLTESFRQDRTWRYELKLFRRPHFGFFSRGETDNRVRIVVPRGLSFRLEGRFDLVSSRLELGGLSVVAADLSANVGTHELRFDEPLPFPMERLTVDNHAGRFEIGHAGNASLRNVEIRQAAGRLDLDLRGEWSSDATVRVDCSVGALDFRLPEGVDLDIEGPIDLGDRLDTGGLVGPDGTDLPPHLRLELHTRLCTARAR